MKKISQGIPLFEGDEAEYSPWLKEALRGRMMLRTEKK